jgi:hypothetical protein
LFDRRGTGSEEVYIARQEEVREEEVRQRLQHEEEQLVRREIQTFLFSVFFKRIRKELNDFARTGDIQKILL